MQKQNKGVDTLGGPIKLWSSLVLLGGEKPATVPWASSSFGAWPNLDIHSVYVPSHYKLWVCEKQSVVPRLHIGYIKPKILSTLILVMISWIIHLAPLPSLGIQTLQILRLSKVILSVCQWVDWWLTSTRQLQDGVWPLHRSGNSEHIETFNPTSLPGSRTGREQKAKLISTDYITDIINQAYGRLVSLKT